MAIEFSNIDLSLKTVYDINTQASDEKFTELYNFSRSLVTTSTLDLLLESTVKYVVNIVQVNFCRLLVINQEQVFECKAVCFSDDENPKKTLSDTQYVQRICARVTKQDKPLVIGQSQESLSLDEGRILHLHGVDYLCLVPMRINSDAIGLLILGENNKGSGNPFHDGKLRLAKLIADQSASAIHRTRLSNYIQHSYLETVLALAKTIEARDPYTGGHSKMMLQYVQRMAEQLGCSLAETQTISLAALLHDIGKIGVPDEVLKKPGPLTEEEWGIMKRHPDIGADIVLSVSRLSGVASIIRAHHERVDGSGYPLGLTREWISLGSRIISVVDAYVAITSDRVYRAGRTHAEAIEEIKKCSGSHFDPQIVDVFLRLFDD
jgi:putative nucleotidyltransferase with HDIG domain